MKEELLELIKNINGTISISRPNIALNGGKKTGESTGGLGKDGVWRW